MVGTLTGAQSKMPRVRSRLGNCYLPRFLLEEMLREADERSPLETGGVLLGLADGVNVWIEAVVGPGPNAHHARTTFVPDAEYQDRRIAEIYEAFGRRISYLGDWHTHPNASPNISWRDQKTLKLISREGKARQTQPLMLIFGDGPRWNAIAWRYVGPRWCGFGVNYTALQLVIIQGNGIG